MKQDAFIEIAARGIGVRMELLHEPQPPRYKKTDCVLSSTDRPAVQTEEKMHTKEQLYAELARLRKQYEQILADQAPEQPNIRKRFDGYAKKLYEAEVNLPPLKENQAAYFCCKGADYKAAVHINNEFAGSHEGFFAPFEFEISDLIQTGKNTLSITLTNDFRFNGNDSEAGVLTEGDKLYAATGLGWDDPKRGWHHCPPGMGLYNEIYIEYRNKTHIHDLFVRPLPQKDVAEVWAWATV